MKFLIVEDEHLAVERLKRMLQNTDLAYEIVGEIDSVCSARKWLGQYECDLIFLDIHLSDGLAFDIFEDLQINIPIIFTTAYDHYAIKAFQLNSIDYLLKPYNQQELDQALTKHRQFFKEPTNIDFKSIADLIKNPKNAYQSRFIVSYGQKLKSIATEDVTYFYAAEKMVFLCNKEGKNFVIDQTLDKLENQLDPHLFFRINRKFLISISAIQEMHSYPKGRVKIELNPPCQYESIVSLEKASDFKKWLNQ